MKRRGCTLIELLVVVAIIALLIAILLPSLGKARELSNRSVCAANVRGIGQSMSVYSADNAESYPIIAGSGSSSPTNVIDTTTAGSAGGSVAVNANVDTMINAMYSASQIPNVMQNMWLLCMGGNVAPKQFVCKSDLASVQAATAAPNGLYYVNFNVNGDQTNARGSMCNSYSFDYPWSGLSPYGIGGWWRNTTDAGLPIMADMAPLNNSGNNPKADIADGTKKSSNSFNHQRDGQNVGFGDAHAEFARTAGIGQNSDNIYCGSSGNASATGLPPTSSIKAPQLIGTGGSGAGWDVIMVPIANGSTYQRL
jgi:prepilin-type N-terminal cleavage/methylation domain-containing protein